MSGLGEMNGSGGMDGLSSLEASNRGDEEWMRQAQLATVRSLFPPSPCSTSAPDIPSYRAAPELYSAVLSLLKPPKLTPLPLFLRSLDLILPTLLPQPILLPSHLPPPTPTPLSLLPYHNLPLPNPSLNTSPLSLPLPHPSPSPPSLPTTLLFLQHGSRRPPKPFPLPLTLSTPTSLPRRRRGEPSQSLSPELQQQRSRSTSSTSCAEQRVESGRRVHDGT